MFNAVKIGNEYDYNYREFVCDTIEDLHAIKTRRLATGSKAIVLKGEGDKQQSYVLTGSREWIVDTATGGGSVQPDWSQNDETAADYVKNRPGGYDITKQETTTLNITSSKKRSDKDNVYRLRCDNLFREYFQTEYGYAVPETRNYLGTDGFVSVEYNGVMYENVPICDPNDASDVYGLGDYCGSYWQLASYSDDPRVDEPAEYPFYIGVDYDMGMGCATDYIFATDENPTIKITRQITTHAEIPAKYIETIQSDWNQIYDSEKDYIKNKPDVVTFSGDDSFKKRNARDNIQAARGGCNIALQSGGDNVAILGRYNVEDSYEYYYIYNDKEIRSYDLSYKACAKRYVFDFENPGITFDENDVFTPTESDKNFYLLYSAGTATLSEVYFVAEVSSVSGSSIKFRGFKIEKREKDGAGTLFVCDNRFIHYSLIVGNGTPAIPSNAHTLDWEGNAWYAGDVYVGSASGTNRDEDSKKLATEWYVNEIADEIASDIDFYFDAIGIFCNKKVSEIGPRTAFKLAADLIRTGHNPCVTDSSGESTASVMSVSMDDNNIYGRYISSDGTIATVTVALSVFTGEDPAPS